MMFHERNRCWTGGRPTFHLKGMVKVLGNTHIRCVKFGTISWLFAKKQTKKNKVHYLSEGNKTANRYFCSQHFLYRRKK